MRRPILNLVIAEADTRTLVRTVADALRRAFPGVPVSNADARRVVIAGAARVNGLTVTRPGAVLRAGDRVAIAPDLSRLARARRSDRVSAALTVLYQDEHLVAVDKPSGLPTHATADPLRPHLVGLLARQLSVPARALAVHQRLDAGTSGVVLFGLSATSNRALAAQFATRTVAKQYLVLVDASRRPDLQPGYSWVARGLLERGGAGRRGRRVVASAAGTAAETTFIVRARRGDRALLEARPRSGRQHQIRAHLAAAGAPIVGDPRYGGPEAARLHLHAWRLVLAHPVSGEPLRLEARAPEGWF